MLLGTCCKGSKPHSRMMHQEGVVSLTPRVLLSTIVCLLQDASGHSNVLKAGKAEELKNARKRRTAS